MARPQKEGIDYFSLDVGFFSDRKIKILQARYGADGIIVYLYILCEIYKDKGYYLKIDDDFNYTTSADLNMSYEKIGQIINFLLERSLFDNTLFKSDKVLTSRGIQERFQLAVKSRAVKKAIEVDEKLWVLKKSETEGFIKCAHFSGFSEINTDKSENNPCLSEEKLHKVKESKVKESKVSSMPEAETAPDRPPVIELVLNDKSLYPIFQIQVDEWAQLYPAVDIMQELRKMKGWLDSNPDRRKTRKGILKFITNWLSREQDKGGNKNITSTPAQGQVKPTNFSNFKQPDFDFKAIENRALGKGRG